MTESDRSSRGKGILYYSRSVSGKISERQLVKGQDEVIFTAVTAV